MVEFLQKPTNSLAGVPFFRGAAQPSSPAIGTYWDELLTSGNVTGEWVWNGSNWLSRQTYQRSVSLLWTQGVLLGGTIGLIQSTTADTPVPMGSVLNIKLWRITASFQTAGTLTGSNYWRLNFKQNGSVVQSVNITSGNNGETTGNVSRTLDNMDANYLYLNRFAVNLQKLNSAPDITVPSALIEYQAIRV